MRKRLSRLSFITTKHQTTKLTGARKKLHQDSDDFISSFRKIVCDLVVECMASMRWPVDFTFPPSLVENQLKFLKITVLKLHTWT